MQILHIHSHSHPFMLLPQCCYCCKQWKYRWALGNAALLQLLRFYRPTKSVDSKSIPFWLWWFNDSHAVIVSVCVHYLSAVWPRAARRQWTRDRSGQLTLQRRIEWSPAVDSDVVGTRSQITANKSSVVSSYRSRYRTSRTGNPARRTHATTAAPLSV